MTDQNIVKYQFLWCLWVVCFLSICCYCSMGICSTFCLLNRGIFSGGACDVIKPFIHRESMLPAWFLIFLTALKIIVPQNKLACNTDRWERTVGRTWVGLRAAKEMFHCWSCMCLLSLSRLCIKGDNSSVALKQKLWKACIILYYAGSCINMVIDSKYITILVRNQGLIQGSYCGRYTSLGTQI